MTVKEYLKTGKAIYNMEFDTYVPNDMFEDWVECRINEGYNIDEMHFYETTPRKKPNLLFDDLEDFCSNWGYESDDVNCIEYDKDALDKINEIFHSMINTLYVSGEPLEPC